MNKFQLFRIRRQRKKLGLRVGQMAAKFGTGRFVDVTQRDDGAVIIESHVNYPAAPRGTIIVTPYQPNHGVMIEFIDESGRSRETTHCDYIQFYKLFSFAKEQSKHDKNVQA